jgi:hypothetical protein
MKVSFVCGGRGGTAYFTMTLAVIRGWSVQKYSYVPGSVNFWLKLSSLSMPRDLNFRAVDTTV